MSYELKVNLSDYTDEEKKEAIRDQRKMRRYKDKSFMEQARINARNKGYSITATITVIVLLATWQKTNIGRILNPPTETLNKEIIVHNLPNEVKLNTRKLQALTERTDEIEKDFSELSYYIKKSLYTNPAE
jgi:hypothetical protein